MIIHERTHEMIASVMASPYASVFRCRAARRHGLQAIQQAITNEFPEAGGGGAAAEVADTEATGGDGAPAGAGDDDDDGGDADGEPARRPPPHARRKAAPLPAPSVQQATTATPPTRPLLKLPEVLTALPVSRSSWYAGMRSGLYPQPVKLGAKSVAWKRSDIDRLIESLAYSN